MATKYAKVSMQMKFLYKDNKVFQYFIVVDTKFKKYVLQNKYALNAKLEKFIEKNALSLVSDKYTFLHRRDDEDRITLEFSYEGEIDKKPSAFFAIVGDIPCSDGCEECRFRDNDKCTKKDKEIDKIVKNCKFFTQSQVQDENRF